MNSVTMNLLGASVGGHIFAFLLGIYLRGKLGTVVCFSGNFPTVSQRTWAMAQSPAVSAFQCSTSLPTLGIVIFF